MPPLRHCNAQVRAELPGMDTAAAVAARQRLEARSAAEEDLMLRVPLSKAEAKKLRAQRRCVTCSSYPALY